MRLLWTFYCRLTNAKCLLGKSRLFAVKGFSSLSDKSPVLPGHLPIKFARHIIKLASGGASARKRAA